MSAEPLRRVALFDLDGTLTPLDTEEQWALWLGDAGLLDAAVFYEFHADYLAGCLDIDAYYAWFLDVFRSVEPEVLAGHRDAMVRGRMLPSVEPRAKTWIRDARESHDVVLLVTASNSFLTDPIATELGFDANLATRLEERGGRFTGRLDGPACLGEGKLHHVGAWLEARGTSLARLEHASFHSDSHNDLPLLRAVHRAVVVRPDERLRAAALEHGWTIEE